MASRPPARASRPPGVEIRAATSSDFAAICALNLADVQHTSHMDLERLAALHELSWNHKVACVDGVVAAFLLAMRSGTPYENDNFRWFSSRYPHFVYIDRIVVSRQHRGAKLATLLYEDLFNCARQAGFRLVTCEYNVLPPNEPSRRFHDRTGFTECGTQWVANGTRKVSLQVAQA
jgi:predicted GNAT superfamily acetyltransferase